MRIIKLISNNIKRLTAVDITPPEHLVQITGANANGKSSVLDSIAIALGGLKAVKDTDVPIHQGAEKGFITVETEDYTITRTFTDPTDSSKTTLKITPKPGALRSNTPQAMLNDLYGKLAFDPLAFAGMKPEEQFTTLAGLVDLGIDLKKWKLDRRATFDERTSANRTVTSLKTQLESKIAPPADLPETETDLLVITQDLEIANSQIRDNDAKRRTLADKEREVNDYRRTVEDLESQLLRAKTVLNQAELNLEKMQGEIGGLVDPDTMAINQRLQSANADNRAIREAADYRKLKADFEAAQTTANSYRATLEQMDTQRTEALQKATFPVPGLSLGDDQVTYNGLPFTQASDSEKLRVSMAVAMALNPKLRVILIRNGSLLDRANLAVIAELAKANDYQVWVETVHEDGDIGIVIEDGKVAWDNYTNPTPVEN